MHVRVPLPRRSARRLADVWRLVRFRLWLARLRLGLRRQGARLIVDVAHAPRFASSPRLVLHALGEGEASVTLRLGRDVDLGRGSTLEVWTRGTNVLELGDGAQVIGAAWLSLRSGAIRAQPRLRLRDGAILRSSGDLRIGTGVAIGFGASVHCARQVELHDGVAIAERATVVDSEHVSDGSDRHYERRDVHVAPVCLERNALVLTNAVILRGSRVGRNAVVAAGAVLTGTQVPDGWLAAGLPARPIKPLAGPASALPQRARVAGREAPP